MCPPLNRRRRPIVQPLIHTIGGLQRRQQWFVSLLYAILVVEDQIDHFGPASCLASLFGADGCVSLLYKIGIAPRTRPILAD
jgi:hypothetical protein